MKRIDNAIEAIRRGDCVVVFDADDRENEADLFLAGTHATPEKVAFFLRHTSGILCAAMPPQRADELDLPPMVAHNTERHGTAFTISVDLRHGTTTGISASDRALTVRALADRSSVPADFSRPGHVFPLRARPGGVLERAGHTEAAVDLARLAGVEPVMLLAELTTPEGESARGARVLRFAREHGLATLTVRELIAHREALADSAVGQTAGDVLEVARGWLPTRYGTFSIRLLRTGDGGSAGTKDHVALVRGDIDGDAVVPVRIHSECLTGDVFSSRRCDCGEQLRQTLAVIAGEGRGVVLYELGHEGRGIGLVGKLRAYALQDQGLDTVDANLSQGFPVDARDFARSARVLRGLGIRRICLLTNNPDKLDAVRRAGFDEVRRRPMVAAVCADNLRYLRTKRDRLGHDLLVPAEQSLPTMEAR